MLDEYDNGVPIHHTFPPMHTNEEFADHILFEHIKKGKMLDMYFIRLPQSPLSWK